MKFDIDQTIKNMGSSIAEVLTDEWPKVSACVTKALEDEKESLQEIAQAHINGEINDEELKSQLEDEQEVFKAALLVCKIKEKVMAQKAANAAIDVLNTAIKIALKV